MVTREEKRFILAIVLESRSYGILGGKATGRALVVHYVGRDRSPRFKVYKYSESDYGYELPDVKFVFIDAHNPYLIMKTNGEIDEIQLNKEYWKNIQTNTVTLT